MDIVLSQKVVLDSNSFSLYKVLASHMIENRYGFQKYSQLPNGFNDGDLRHLKKSLSKQAHIWKKQENDKVIQLSVVYLQKCPAEPTVTQDFAKMVAFIRQDCQCVEKSARIR